MRQQRHVVNTEAFDILCRAVPGEMKLKCANVAEILAFREVCAVADNVIRRNVKLLDARGCVLSDALIAAFRNNLAPLLALDTLLLSSFQLDFFSTLSDSFFHSITSVDIESPFTSPGRSTMPVDWLARLPHLYALHINGSADAMETQFPPHLPVRHLVIRSEMSEWDARVISQWPNVEILDISEMYVLHRRTDAMPSGGWPSLQLVVAQMLTFFNNIFGAGHFDTLIMQRAKGLQWMHPPEERIFTAFETVWMEPSKSHIQHMDGADGTMRARKILIPRNPAGDCVPEALFVIPLYFNVPMIEVVTVDVGNEYFVKTACEFLMQHRIPHQIIFKSNK